MIGIDAEIEKLKDRFALKLFLGSTYNSIGRVFITRRDGQELPEMQVSGTEEYQEVLPNDKIDGHSFFLVSDELEKVSDDFLKANVSIYFSVNLDALYPAISERAVEYLHRDVMEIIEQSRFNLLKLVTGIRAFDMFGFVKDTDNMEPYYLVRFDTEINYNQKC